MARYTLQQLIVNTQNALKFGTMNEMVEGYPLLHSILIELRDEKDPSKRGQYVKLIRNLLLDKRTDVNIRDKHSDTPLIAAASEIGSLGLVKIFMAHRADPNLTTRAPGRRTALEQTVLRLPENTRVLDYLNSVTKKTKFMRHNLRELLQVGIEEEELPLINAIMRLGIIHYSRVEEPMIPDRLAIDFYNGFWVRTISDMSLEIDILNKREFFSEKALQLQGHLSAAEVKGSTTYTPYSSATFVKHPVPIRLFESNDFGVIIRPVGRTIVHWYDGQHGEQLTRDWSFDSRMPLGHGVDGEYRGITEAKVSAKITALYTSSLQRFQKQSGLDQYGILIDQYKRDLEFTWNEGLFRYKRAEIIGIYVDPSNIKNLRDGLKFRRLLALKVPLYYYDGKSGMRQIFAEERKQRLSYVPPVTDMTRVCFWHARCDAPSHEPWVSKSCHRGKVQAEEELNYSQHATHSTGRITPVPQLN